MAAVYGHSAAGPGLEKSFQIMLAASAVLHVLGIAVGFFILPQLTSGVRHLPPVYTVNLVSSLSYSRSQGTVPEKISKLPAAPPAPAKTPPVPVKPAAVKKTERIPVGPVESKPKAKNTQPKAVKTPVPAEPARRPDPGREIDQAVSNLQASGRDSQAADKRIAEALSRLGEGRNVGAGDSDYGLKGSGPPGELEASLREYAVVITNIISANWNMPPDILIRKQGALETIYIIQVDGGGKITNGWFEQKSGDRFFDQSAAKAVARSSPLPPPPAGAQEFGLRFTPSGLRGK